MTFSRINVMALLLLVSVTPAHAGGDFFRHYDYFDARSASSHEAWIEDAFRHNGQAGGDAFKRRHGLANVVESAVGLALLPFHQWDRWRQRHHEGLRQFRRQQRSGGDFDWNHPFFEKQRARRKNTQE